MSDASPVYDKEHSFAFVVSMPKQNRTACDSGAGADKR